MEGRITRCVGRWSVHGRAEMTGRGQPMTRGAYALLTASDTAMQRQREEEGEDTITGAPITFILWCEMTVIRQSHADMIESILRMHE